MRASGYRARSNLLANKSCLVGNRLWLGWRRRRGLGFKTWLGLEQEIERLLLLFFAIGLAMRGRAELLVLELAQHSDLLPAVETLHALSVGSSDWIDRDRREKT